MDLFNKLLASLSKEESRFFKLYLLRTNSEQDRKDVQLFDTFKKSKEIIDESKIVPSLYPNQNKNAYYRLKNRLTQDVYKSLFLQYCEQEPFPFLYYMLGLVSMFIERKQFDIALNLLEKLEPKALSKESYEILDLIYTQFINISIATNTVNATLYLKKRKQNREKLNKQIFEHDYIAFLDQKFKEAVKFSPEKNPLSNFLNASMEEFSSDSIRYKNPIFRYKVFCCVYQNLIRRAEYNTLEIYLLTSFLQFNDEGFFEGSNENLKLNFLKPLILALIINKKFERALNYWQKLSDAYQKTPQNITIDEKFFLINSWFHIQFCTSSTPINNLVFPTIKIQNEKDNILIEWIKTYYYLGFCIQKNVYFESNILLENLNDTFLPNNWKSKLNFQIKIFNFLNSLKQTDNLMQLNFFQQVQKMEQDFSLSTSEKELLALTGKIFKVKKSKIEIAKTKNSQKLITKFIQNLIIDFEGNAFYDVCINWLKLNFS